MTRFLEVLSGVFIVFFVLLLVFADDKVEAKPDLDKEIKNAEMSSKTLVYSGSFIRPGKPFLKRIGDKKELIHVKHVTDDKYEVGYLNKKNELYWTTIYAGKYNGSKVVYEKIEKSYIERIKNDVSLNRDKDRIQLIEDEYIIHVPMNIGVGAGVVEERHCEKSGESEQCHKDTYQTTILNP